MHPCTRVSINHRPHSRCGLPGCSINPNPTRRLLPLWRTFWVISAEAIVIVFSFFPIEKNVRGVAAERSACPRMEDAAVKASGEGADAWRASGLASAR